MPKFTRYSVSVLLVMLCIIMLALVHMLRESPNPLIGTEAYFNLRIAKSISLNDPLSYGGRFSAYSFGLPLLLSLAPEFFSNYLPIMLGVLSFMVFGLLLKGIKGVEEKDAAVSLIVLLISPPFIYLFSTINRHAPAVLLALLGMLFFQKNKNFLKPLAVLSFVLTPLFSIPITIIMLGLLSLYVICFRENKKLFYLISTLVILELLSYFIFYSINSGLPELRDFSPYYSGINFLFQRLISDFGAINGLGLFGVMISIFGIAACWSRKYSNPFVFFSFLALMILSFFRPEPIFLFNFFLSFFIAKGITQLFVRQWESRIIMLFTILILFCGLIFSGVSHINLLVKQPPSKEIIEGINFLKDHQGGVVFSHYTRGSWISYSGHPNVMDENFFFAPKLNERWKDSQTMFNIRDLKTALEIIDKYNIEYIWVDNGMRQMLWEEDEEGLQFVLKYSKQFTKEYSNNEVEIWKFEEAK